MAIRPNFAAPPLVQAEALPLGAGSVRWSASNGAWNVYTELGGFADEPCAWEAGLRLAALLTDQPLESVFAERIRDAVKEQDEDGSWPGAFRDGLATARACFSLWRLSGESDLLRASAAWLSWFASRMDELIAAGAGEHLADLWELLENMYRVTGRKPALKLLSLLRQSGMDWASALHTFSLQRGMEQTVSFADLQAETAGEDADRRAHYRRMAAMYHAETLGDGMRAALLQGRFSGNAAELTAGRVGWEKISRWHGAACGGTTADEYLAGRLPSRGICDGAVGAWAETFALLSEEKDGAWAVDELERIVCNALPAAKAGLQRVNSVPGTERRQEPYARITDRAHEAARLARGWASAASHAVLQRPEGAEIQLFCPGLYHLWMRDQPAVLKISRADQMTFTLELAVRQESESELRIRIPAWAEHAVIALPEGGEETPQAGSCFTLKRVWKETAKLTVRLTPALRTEEGPRQSVAVYLGPWLMSMPAQESGWNAAAAGQPVKTEAGVELPVRGVPAWTKPEELPVLPSAAGETRQAPLRRYAETANGVALFPRERGT